MPPGQQSAQRVEVTRAHERVHLPGIRRTEYGKLVTGPGEGEDASMSVKRPSRLTPGA